MNKINITLLYKNKNLQTNRLWGSQFNCLATLSITGCLKGSKQSYMWHRTGFECSHKWQLLISTLSV
jgi:hypothetical protein